MSFRRGWMALIVLLVLAGLAWQRVASHAPAQRPPSEAPGARTAAGSAESESAQAASSSATAYGPNIGFRTNEFLREHWLKHGREFGDVSMREYLRRAQQLRDRPAGGAILEQRRDDGVITRFDRGSGAFIAFDADGIIRTFFRPNQGEVYFRRQLTRPHHRGGT